MYYLLYNISSKIFAFLLLPPDCFALHQVQRCSVRGGRINLYFYLSKQNTKLININVQKRGPSALSPVIFQTVLRGCDPFEMLERELLRI